MPGSLPRLADRSIPFADFSGLGNPAPKGGRDMYKQVLDPVSHSLGLSSIFAVLPLLALFVLLGAVRMKAQWASLLSLVVALVVALAVYKMPVGQGLDSAAEG